MVESNHNIELHQVSREVSQDQPGSSPDQIGNLNGHTVSKAPEYEEPPINYDYRSNSAPIPWYVKLGVIMVLFTAAVLVSVYKTTGFK